MRRLLVLRRVALGVVIVLLVMACGAGDSSSDEAAPTTPATTTVQAEPQEIDPIDIPAQQLCAEVAEAFPGALTAPELSAGYKKLEAETILEGAAALGSSNVSDAVRRAATDLDARLAEVENIDFDAPLMLGLVNDVLEACQPLGSFERTGLLLEEVPSG